MEVGEKNDAMHLPIFGVSVLNDLSWKEQTQTQQLAAVGFGTFSLSGSGEPDQFTSSPIRPSLLPVIGVSPIAGREFREHDGVARRRAVSGNEGLRRSPRHLLQHVPQHADAGGRRRCWSCSPRSGVCC